MEVQSVRLHRDRTRQHAAQQPQSVREAGADDDPVGLGTHTPGTRQVLRQRLAELHPAPWIPHAEGVVGRGGDGSAGGGQPGGAREGGRVGGAGHQVVHHALPGAVPRAALPGRIERGGPPGDPGAGALAGEQPALRHEFGIGVGNGVAGDAQVLGETAVRGQPGAGGEPAGTDGLPQGVHEPAAQASLTGEVEVEIGSPGPLDPVGLLGPVPGRPRLRRIDP